MDQMEAAGLPGPMTLGGVTLPLVGRARVYACGITPYDVTHVGHAAAFVWVDTLARVLRACGAEVIICRNVTDVDDVLLAAADRAGSPYDRFAAIQQFYFDRDMAALGVGQPALQPRAHAYIGQVIALAAGLLDRGAAYERDGQVWFRGAAAARAAVPDRDLALRLAAEYGDDPADPAKDDPFDVAVWRGRPVCPVPAHRGRGPRGRGQDGQVGGQPRPGQRPAQGAFGGRRPAADPGPPLGSGLGLQPSGTGRGRCQARAPARGGRPAGACRRRSRGGRDARGAGP